MAMRHLIILLSSLFILVSVASYIADLWFQGDNALFNAGITAVFSLLLLGPGLFWLSENRTSDNDESLQRQASSFDSSAKAISENTSQMAIGAAEVSHFLDKLNASIGRNGEYASKIVIAAEHLNSATTEISSSAGAASQLATQTHKKSEEGSQLAHRSLAAICELSSDVNSAADSLAGLKQNADQIQGITEVINSVAEQTNLLALNAAIEAARAGEQGRGFAVVADEVRSLAGKTAEATQNIANMLREVRQKTENTSAMMGQVVEHTDSVVANISELDETFVQISQMVDNSVEAVQHIESALDEQTGTAAEISQSISGIRDSLSETKVQSETISEQAFQLSCTAEKTFAELDNWNTGTFEQRVLEDARQAAQAIGLLFEQAISLGQLSEHKLFNQQYKALPNTNPAKFSTDFDGFTDQNLPDIQEPILGKHQEVIYAGAVDSNGYFPTHNKRFSKSLTGNYEVDLANNRTKRIFDDPTGRRCGKHTETVLLQTYKRDTGEVMHDLSVPIKVNGRHWGGFRIGFRACAA